MAVGTGSLFFNSVPSLNSGGKDFVSKYNRVYDESNAYWNTLVGKYASDVNPEPIDGWIPPSKKITVLSRASPEELKKLYSYDVRLKYLNKKTGNKGRKEWGSPVSRGMTAPWDSPRDGGINEDYYGSEGLGWFDPESLGTKEGKDKALQVINSKSDEEVKSGTKAINYSIGKRFESEFEDRAGNSLIGKIGMGLWKGAVSFITGNAAGMATTAAANAFGVTNELALAGLSGAASGSAGAAAIGEDPLKGALIVGGAKMLLAGTGLGKWAKDKFKEITGQEATSEADAIKGIAEVEGTSVENVIEEGGSTVYGEDFNIGNAPDFLGRDTTGFQYNWETGELVSNVDGGLPGAILGPDASLGIGNALTGTAPGAPPEYTIEPNTGEVTPTQDVMDSIIPSDPQDLFNVPSGSGNTESPESGGGSGGGGFDLSDLAKYGTPLVGAGLSLYDYFKRQEEAEDLEEANRRAAERADPWGDYRPGYANRLNEFMQTSPNLPDAPNRQSPLDFAQDNPYVSTSGLNEFLQDTPTPIERMEANPFESQSGLFELLKDPNSIKESPAYQFRLNQGLNALDRRLASAGHRFSGNRMTAITDYAQGAASQEFENEFGRRAQYYDREFGLYRTDADRYLQNYIGEANTRAATENINRSQYDTDMDRYGDEFGREYDRYVTDYELEYNTYQKNLENLMKLAGVNPNAQSEGAGYGLQGVTVGNLQDQANRGNLADAGLGILEFLSKL